MYRFAPSPNGHLHLGHALSALMNRDLAAAAGGILLLRLEDIDRARCREAYVGSILEDLAWLGISWAGVPRRQSRHFGLYGQALDRLAARGLVYPCFCTRGAVHAAAAAQAASAGLSRVAWVVPGNSASSPSEGEQGGVGEPTPPCLAASPVDPDGAPLYPGTCRRLSAAERSLRLAGGRPAGLRLDMEAAVRELAAPLAWTEAGEGSAAQEITADPSAWGDALLARKDVPTSYHLSVVVDDAAQGVTDVVRGRDLLPATALHRLLQALLGLPAPRYHHHRLIVDSDGRKLSKSRGAPALRDLRAQGVSAETVRSMVGLR